MARLAPLSWLLVSLGLPGLTGCGGGSPAAEYAPSSAVPPPPIANVDFVPPNAISAAQAIEKAKTGQEPGTITVLGKLIAPEEPCPPCPPKTACAPCAPSANLFNDGLRATLPARTAPLVIGQRYVLEGKMARHIAPAAEWVLVVDKISVLH